MTSNTAPMNETNTPMDNNTLTDADFEACADKAGLAAGVICLSFRAFMADQGIAWSDEFVKPAATALIGMVVKAELAAKGEELATANEAIRDLTDTMMAIYERLGLHEGNVPPKEKVSVTVKRRVDELLTAQTAAAEGLRAMGDKLYQWFHRETEMHEHGDDRVSISKDAMVRLCALIEMPIPASPSPWRDVTAMEWEMWIHPVIDAGNPNHFKEVSVLERERMLRDGWKPIRVREMPAPPTPQQDNDQ